MAAERWTLATRTIEGNRQRAQPLSSDSISEGKPFIWMESTLCYVETLPSSTFYFLPY